jgi:hypothetical protein
VKGDSELVGVGVNVGVSDRDAFTKVALRLINMVAVLECEVEKVAIEGNGLEEPFLVPASVGDNDADMVAVLYSVPAGEMD